MENWDQKQSQSSTIIVEILLSKVFNTALLSEKLLIKGKDQGQEKDLLHHFIQVLKAN